MGGSNSETVRKMDADQAVNMRAALHEELAFHPAMLDEESIAEYRCKDTEERERYSRYLRKYGGPGGSHYDQFRHLRPKLSSPPFGEAKPSWA